MTPSLEEPPPSPRLAVVIVSRASRAALIRSLEELKSLPQLIVVDNGSNDTAGLDDRFPGVRWIRLPRNFGLTKALNLGIRAADAEMVLLLSADVLITRAAIEALAATLETEPAVGASAPLLTSIDGTPLPQVSALPTPANPIPALRPASPGETPECVSEKAILLRSFFLRALRHIDERYGDYGPAIELSRQLQRSGKTIRIHSAVRAVVESPAVEFSTAEQADQEIGAARYLFKHFGFAAWLSYLVKRIGVALATFRIRKFWLLINQQKIDGG